MPYIDPDQRKRLDENIDGLSIAIKGECNESPQNMAGALNYACTRIALTLYPDKRYWQLALVVGIFVTVVLEYYRRWVAPYEDEKIRANGDVYPQHIDAGVQ